MNFIIRPLVNLASGCEVCGCLFSDSNCSDCEFKGWDDCKKKAIW